MKPLVSNPQLKPKFYWFRLKPEQINWVIVNFEKSVLVVSMYKGANFITNSFLSQSRSVFFY